MYDTETKHKFIELRAKGISVRRIAEELGVHRNTLADWNREFATRIENLRLMELEALQEELLGCQADRFKALAADYHRYHNELENRQPQHIPQYMLFRMVCRLRDQLERRIVTPDFLVETSQPLPSPGGEGQGEGGIAASSPQDKP